MALLAEELVEEWLNRQGYFTIRGIKLGVHEIDLLAMKVAGDTVICRHIEVQASIRPIGYLCPLTKSIQASTGRAAMSVKHRSEEELGLCVKDWVKKKYHLSRKQTLRSKLYAGHWSLELVVHNLRHPEELAYVKNEGIEVHQLSYIVRELSNSESVIESACGADLVDLVRLD